MELNRATYVIKAGYAAWYGFLLFFSYLMLLITLQYIPARTNVAFLLVKEDVVGMLYYRIAFFAHVYTGIFVLIAGMLQFPAYIRKHYLAAHRWCGRIYAYGIIMITGPAGLIMGFYANGGWISRSGFCLLAVLWVTFTWKGVSAAQKRNITAHKKWMYRSYALTLSAISLRLLRWVFVLLFAPNPMDVYHVVSWLGWTGNLVIAELLIYYTFKKKRRRILELTPVESQFSQQTF